MITLNVLIARQDASGAWHKVAVGKHIPGVGTSFPLASVNSCKATHRDLEKAVHHVHEEPGCVSCDLIAPDGAMYRVGPFF